MALLILVAALAACSHAPSKPDVIAGSIIVRSREFEQGGTFPAKYTCNGDDVSPPLVWSNLPPGTRSMNLLMFDLDARLFVHWKVDGIPAEVNAVEEGTNPPGHVGVNGFGSQGYRGPCPPSGMHRYVIELRAFDSDGGHGKPLGSGTLQASYAKP